MATRTSNPIHYWLVKSKGVGFTKIDLGTISTTLNGTTTAIAQPSLMGAGAIIQNSGAPTDVQCATALAVTPLAAAQAAQIAGVQADFDAQLAAGVTATGGGITATLPADVASQNTFTRFVVTLIAAQVPDSTTESIFDINGAPVTGTSANIKALIAAYAIAIKTAQIALLTNIAAIQAATTVAAVQAIGATGAPMPS